MYTTDPDLANATLENTISYAYEDSNWADKLTSYNGENIVYDAIGNPLEYRGWELEWSRGRRLDKASNPKYNINISFRYDENGIRTQKIVNGVQTDFVTSGIKVLAQKSGENTIVWQIDGNGNTVGFNHNGISYFYIKNLQGDIIGITDNSGNIVAKYIYDSWGKLISIKDSSDVDKTDDTTFIGYINPIRYRGYYYDSEIGLYYLNARYYDPKVGRFINADETLSGGYNLFGYCLNDPVNLSDLKGKRPADTRGYIGEYNTIDEAAIAFGMYINEESIRNGWEYYAVIYRLPNGKYTFHQPETDECVDESDVQRLLVKDSGKFVFYGVDFESIKANKGVVYPIVATIHTHGSYSWRYKNDIFSEDDVNNAVKRNLPNYMVNPLGELRVYDPNNVVQNDYYKTKGRLVSIHMPYDPRHPGRNGGCLCCTIL